MLCPRCGSEAPPGNRFCGRCGAPLETAPDREGAAAGPPPVSEAPTAPLAGSSSGPGPSSLTPGTLLDGRFRIESFVGRGGFGAVYRAFDVKLERVVALKLLSLAQTSPRFRREALALAALNHPAIVTVFDVGEAEGMAYIAMELAEGENLGDRLRRAPPPWDEMAEISLQVAGALDHAHQRGILHRDVKPANIMISPSGAVKVTDLGIARALESTPITDRGEVFGTIEYLAPELLRDEEPDVRADIYSLGVCMYEGLAGRVPLTGDTPARVMRKVLGERPEPLGRLEPDLPPALLELVDSCLDKDRSGRPSTAREVELGLRRLLERDTGREASPYAVPVPSRLSTRSLQPEVEGERKKVVLLLVRERHMEDLLEELPVEEIQALRASCFEEIFPLIERHRGRVEEVGGEEFLVVFGLPHREEGDEERAIRCAMEIRDCQERMAREKGRPLRISMGIHAGHAFAATGADRYMLRSAAVRLSRRLAEKGKPGEVLVGAPVAEIVAGRFEFAAAGSISRPGEAEPFRILRLGSPKSGEPFALDRRQWGTVGREPELNLLRHAARRALEGTGQVVFIMGEAGIGKTHLVSAFLSEASDPSVTGTEEALSILVVQGRPAGEQAPYRAAADLAGLLRSDRGDSDAGPPPEAAAPAAGGLSPQEARALRSLSDSATIEEGPEVLEPEEYPRILAAALRKLLLEACSRCPVVLVLEDLHWFDGPSLEVLREVLAGVHGQRALVLATYRTGLDAGFGSLRNHQLIALGPLRPDEDLELARRFLGIDEAPAPLRQILGERSEGNPLYTFEFLRMALEKKILIRREGGVEVSRAPSEEEVPGSIEGILAARIDRLDPEARRLLQAAAVLGREFPLDLLEEVRPGPEDLSQLLAELGRRGILHLAHRDGSVICRFDHSLTRHVAYSNILQGSRRQLHRRAAEALEKLHPDRPGALLDLLAHHWTHSDSRDRAVEALREAMEHNRLRFRKEAAIGQCGKALALMDKDNPERFDLLLERSSLLVSVGRSDDAARDAEEALVQADGGQDRTSAAHLAIGKALHESGRFEAALGHYEAAAETAGADPAGRELALRGQAEIVTLLGRADEALGILGRLEVMLEGREDRMGLAFLHSLRGTVFFDRGETQASLREHERALALYRETGDRGGAVTNLYTSAIPLMAMGRYAEAIDRLAEAEREALALGMAKIRVTALSSIAHARIQTGDLLEAENVLRDLEAYEASHSLAWHQAGVLRLRGLLSFFRGEYDQGVLSLRKARRKRSESGDHRAVSDCDLVLARVYLECGQTRWALELAEAVGLSAVERQDPFQRCEAGILHAAALAALGDLPAALRVAIGAEEIARQFGEPETLVPALSQRGALLQGEEARALLDESLGIARGCGLRLEEARALLRRGEVLLHEGRNKAAAADARIATGIGDRAAVPELIWKGEGLHCRALEAQGETEKARRARDRARGILMLVSQRIGDPELARGYRRLPARAVILAPPAAPTGRVRRPDPPAGG